MSSNERQIAADLRALLGEDVSAETVDAVTASIEAQASAAADDVLEALSSEQRAVLEELVSE